MAEVSKQMEVVPTVEKIVGYTLDLSVEEAEALFAVLSKVGGSETKSPRGLMQNIYWALAPHMGNLFELSFYQLAEGNIHFGNYHE